MAKIVMFNQKGGVGKSTSVLNLAAALCRRNLPPLVIDLDTQGYLTQAHPQALYDIGDNLFGYYQGNKTLSELFVEWSNVGQLIPAHRQLAKIDTTFGKGPAVLMRLGQGLASLERDAQFGNILVDCCPHLGVLSLSAIFAADVVIIPISSDYLSLQGALKVERTLSVLEPVLKRRVNRRYLLTRHDRRRNMSSSVHQNALEAFGEDVLETVISESVAVAESPQLKKDIFSYKCSSVGAKDYNDLLDELISQKLVDAKTHKTAARKTSASEVSLAMH